MTDPMLPGGTTVVVAEPMTSARPPDRPSLPPARWLRENLFPNKRNAALTVLAALFAIIAFRGLLNFVFSEERTWTAVRTNLRLLFTQAYPEEQYMRVWVSVGTVMVLTGLSIGIWARWGGVSIKRLMGWLVSSGAFIAAGIVLREPSVLTDADGSSRRSASDELVRESFASAMADRWMWWLLAAVLIGGGLALWASRDDLARRTAFVPTTGLFFGFVGIIIGSTWIVPYGHYGFTEGEFIAEPGRTVALTTKVPWTVMWLLLVGCFAIGRIARGAGLGERTRRRGRRRAASRGPWPDAGCGELGMAGQPVRSVLGGAARSRNRLRPRVLHDLADGAGVRCARLRSAVVADTPECGRDRAAGGDRIAAACNVPLGWGVLRLVFDAASRTHRIPAAGRGRTAGTQLRRRRGAAATARRRLGGGPWRSCSTGPP